MMYQGSVMEVKQIDYPAGPPEAVGFGRFSVDHTIEPRYAAFQVSSSPGRVFDYFLGGGSTDLTEFITHESFCLLVVWGWAYLIDDRGAVRPIPSSYGGYEYFIENEDDIILWNYVEIAVVEHGSCIRYAKNVVVDNLEVMGVHDDIVSCRGGVRIPDRIEDFRLRIEDIKVV